MLRIYDDLLALVRELKPYLEQLERQDADLARQLRRALWSGPLNVAEGSQSAGGNRTQRYRTALGSTREVLSCLEVGAAAGLLPDLSPVLQERFGKIIGTLVKVVRR
jgi:four helix bundle protein